MFKIKLTLLNSIGLIVLIFLITCCSSKKNTSKKTNPIEFKTLYKEFYCAQTQKKNYVIKNNKELEDFWKQTFSKEFPIRDLPRIDFSNQMMIACFSGEFSSGGYSIEIESISKHKNTLTVNTTETNPGKNCGVTSAFSQPFHIISLNLFEGEIDYINTSRSTSCN